MHVNERMLVGNTAATSEVDWEDGSLDVCLSLASKINGQMCPLCPCEANTYLPVPDSRSGTP